MTQLLERPNKLAMDYIYNLNDDDLISMIYDEQHILEEQFQGGKYATSKKKQKQQIFNIKKYIEFCMANDFENPVKYNQRKSIYRMEGEYPSIQHIKGCIRGLFFKHNTFDIDQCSSHPVILLYLVNRFCPDLPIGNLKEYVNDREKYLKQLIDTNMPRNIAKMCFLRIINKQDRLKTKERFTPFLDSFDKEIKNIQIALGCVDEFSVFMPANGVANKLGKFMANLLQHWEHKVNSIMISYLEKNNFEIAAYMHDGALVYEPSKSESQYDNPQLLLDIEREVETHYPGLNMKWSYKRHSEQLSVPEDYEEQGLESGYVNAKNKWEKLGYCKVTDNVCFMKVSNDGTTLKYTKNDIKIIGEDFGYSKFIDNWLEDSDKKVYRTIGQYPPDQVCPSDVYNTWIPFAGERMEFQEDKEGMEVLLNHFKILCDNDEIYNHFVKWLAYIIQKPSKKNAAKMPIFIGLEEGGGKGTLVDIIRRMLGEKKVMETTMPSRHVFGSFNGEMENAYLIYLNEMSKREMSGMEEHLKSYLTDNYITINQKHVKPFSIRSYHKFICSTNNLQPKTSTEASRRDWYINIPDTLVGDTEYFMNIRKFIESDDAIGTLYKYLKELDIENFENEPYPKGEYQLELEQDSRKPIELWTEEYVKEMLDNEDNGFGEFIENKELWEHYKKWLNGNNPNWTFMDRATFTRHLSMYVFNVIYPNFRKNKEVFKRSNGKTYFKFIKNDMCIHFKLQTCMLNP